jgi:transcriptional regulator with XRE-family HTH domain
MTFAEKLRQLREAKGLSQSGLSAASGIPLGTIRDYEQGRRDPLLSNAQKLAKALGASLDAFPPSGVGETAPRGGKGKAAEPSARARKGK